ncbi:hypothetical protein ACUV84_030340 [Puccinellia chinampoensis]
MAGSVVLFPLPLQGHLTPMLQLADVLHHRGQLAVTILHTAFNAPNPAAHPEFTFVAVPHGMPDDTAAGSGIAMILSLNAAVEASGCVRDALASILSEEPRPCCLVIDAMLTGVQKAAAELGLPTIVLQTGSAASVRWTRSYSMLLEKGYLPAKEDELHLPVKELWPLRVSDLFDPSKLPNKEMAIKLLDLAVETTTNSSGIIINTFEALEAAELEALRDELAADGIRVFDIGPLHKLSNVGGGGATSSLVEQDRSCIEWLDSRATASVLYVGFGSFAKMQQEDLAEIAWGLANSGIPFLWVVRRGLVVGMEEPELPEGFEREVEGRGKVLRWAPQQEVLAHPAVGGFWTHSGWNSTLEGISEGVPMLSRPFFGDQVVNGRYVQDKWEIGFLLQGKLERGEINQAIVRLIKGEQGAEARGRASELKIKAMMCLENGGSTHRAVDELIHHMLSL